jgi:hypothetical protein
MEYKYFPKGILGQKLYKNVFDINKTAFPASLCRFVKGM